LFCYGCAHSAASEPFPGRPSGERPCCFCIRNPNPLLQVTTWYDGSSPVKFPMDCYHSSDMKRQMYEWDKKKPLEVLKREAEGFPEVV
jgi:hypothetical protein